MASSDALPVPKKNVAYRVIFPIFDADGDLVTGAAGLDSEVSKDQGTFADCTNEATEIATSSGMYYLDLTSTEMNADCVAIIVKTSTSGAKTTPIVLYPEEAGDIRADVTQLGGSSQSATDLKDFADAGYDPSTNKVQGVVLTDTATTLTNLPTIPANWLTAAGTAADFWTEGRTSINGGDWALSTNALGMIRVADGTATGEVDTSSGHVTLADGSLVTAKLGTFALAKTTNITGFNDLSAAQVNTEADAALVDIGLDHLLAASVAGTDVTDNSIIAKLVSKSATADWDTFLNTTESLEALRDRGDAAWTTATGFSTHSAADVWAVGTRTITALDEDDTAIDFDAAVRASVGLSLANLATLLANIQTDTDAIEVDTQDIQSRLPAALVGGRMDSSVGAMAANTLTAAATAADFSTEVRTAINGGDWALSTNALGMIRVADGTATGEIDSTSGGVLVSQLATQAKADVNAEVLDVFATDTYTEPSQGAPPSTASFSTMTRYLYVAWRNKKTQTATEQKIFADDGTTALVKATVSDDGTTLTVGEYATGA